VLASLQPASSAGHEQYETVAEILWNKTPVSVQQTRHELFCKQHHNDEKMVATVVQREYKVCTCTRGIDRGARFANDLNPTKHPGSTCCVLTGKILALVHEDGLPHG
jgi:hypothetical protein